MAALVGGALAAPSHAARLDPKDVPAPLRPWVPWVLRGHEDAACPFLHGGDDDAPCVWPARLELVLGDRGGRFAQTTQVFREEWVPLPGDAEHWPQDVRVDGHSAAVVEQADGPAVRLPTGEHQLGGAWAWDALPESLAVPDSTGLLALSLRGKPVEFPHRDESGRLFLEGGGGEGEEESLQIRVHRRVIDEVPLQIVTRVNLRYAGRNRELLLGRALPEGFVPLALDAALPARLEPDGHLRVQVRPGDFTVTITARHPGPLDDLARPDPKGPWAGEDEIWVFDARPALRVVDVEGAPTIDPAQTTLGADWRSLPAYLVRPDTRLRLAERRRGDAEPAPDALTLHRTLWLDFDGGGFSARDTLGGTLSRAWRLDAGRLELGRIAVGGTDQLVTHGPDGSAGIEIRQGRVRAVADLRLGGSALALPAVGWNHDMDTVSARLELPAGWRLAHAWGADSVPGTWMDRWTLLDLFLVLVTALAVARLFGRRWGAVALVTLALVAPETDDLRWAWVAVVVAEALVRLPPEGRVRSALRVMRAFALLVLVVLTIPFAVQHVRVGLHPALERPLGSAGGDGGRFGWGGKNRDDESNAMPQSVVPEAPEPAAAGAAAPAADEDGSEEEAEKPRPKPKREAKGKDKEKADRKAGVLGESGKAGLVIDGLDVDDGRSLTRGPIRDASQVASRRARLQVMNAQAIDPNALVQTGPGMPSWSWQAFDIGWSGPVARGQTLGLLLLPPWLNLVLAFLRVGLLGLLLLRVCGGPDQLARLARLGATGARGAALLALLAFAAALGAPGTARAQAFPQKELLDELRAALTEAPACHPSCASIPRLILEATPTHLRLRLEIGAEATTAVPLPGDPALAPASVLLDGHAAAGLRRDDEGVLWLALGPGLHQVTLESPLPPRETVPLSLPLPPHRVEAHAQGWTVDGIHDDGVPAESLQLTRVHKEGGATSALTPGALPPFVRVVRTIHLGLTWQVDTEVARVSPGGAAIVLDVPLLPGESVTTAGVHATGGKVQMNLGADAASFGWTSTLVESKTLELTAPPQLAWTEVWRLDTGPAWHAEARGLPPLHPAAPPTLRQPEWHPWPGEHLTVAVTRPVAVAGRTLTIDEVNVAVAPGARTTESTLGLRLRSSRGGQHILALPDGAELTALTVNGVSQPIRQEGRKVTLSVVPGTLRATLAFREPRGLGARFATPAVDLGVPAVNVSQAVSMPGDRWILLVGGPALGPAVMFWSLLVVLLLVATALGRVRFTPLGTRQWMLLGVGLSQVPIGAAAFVACWLLVLGLRAARPARGRWLFNLGQLALVVATAIALGLLLDAVRAGLLGTPDMQIGGNGSHAGSLRWFADRSAGPLPEAWVLSVPRLAYRAAMLAWALWLAAALIRWLRWAFTCFTTGGAWRKRPPKPPKPAGPAPAGPASAPAAPTAAPAAPQAAT